MFHPVSFALGFQEGGGGVAFAGVHELEQGWNMISVPSRFGLWTGGALIEGVPTLARVAEYVHDQLEYKYGIGCVERYSQYVNNGVVQRYYTFIPGVTPRGNVNNFELMPLDPSSGNPVVQGFWVKSLNLGTMQLEWTQWL